MIDDTQYVKTTAGNDEVDVQITAQNDDGTYVLVATQDMDGNSHREIEIPVGTKAEIEELRTALNSALDDLAKVAK